jgi:ApaG protein
MINKMRTPHKIAITVKTEYLFDESDAVNDHHVFTYTINIENKGKTAARVLGRHWIITDSDGNTREIRGEGIVGEQPRLNPGENFEYSSFAIINTPIGSMTGSYQMISESGQIFEAEIPTFSLANPVLIN